MSVAYVAPIAGQSLSFFSATAGAPTFSQANLRSGGGDTLCECAAVTTNTHIGDTLPASTRQLVISGWFCAHNLGGANSPPILIGNGPTNPPQIKITTAGVLQASTGGTTVSGPTVAIDTWFRLDVLFDTSTTTFTITWYVNGLLQTQASASGQTAADQTSYNAGVCNNLATTTIRIMDLIYSTTAADVPLGSYITKLAAPSGVGTHVETTGDFIDDTAANVTTSDTTSYAKVNEMPPSNTTRVQQAVQRTTSYLEYTLTAAAVAPAVVCAIVGYQGSSANGYGMEVRLKDATTEGTDVTSTGTKSGVTARFTTKQLTSQPSGGSWTPSLARMRFGYSGDVVPNPQLNSMGLVYAYVQPTTGGILPMASAA